MSVECRPIAEGERYRALVREHGSPLLVIDCEAVRTQYRALAQALPKVRLYYAIKSFPHPVLIQELLSMGGCFDLATSGEIDLVRRLGVPPRRTIHTHPIKTDAEIRAALRYGCTTFVVDNALELQKFVRYRHRVGLMIRVGFRNPYAQVDLARKFGCAPEDVATMLLQARQLGIHVKGLSFHVGSQSEAADAHVEAIERSAALIESTHEMASAPLSILDIGGGFPVNYRGDTQGIDAFCRPIREALAALPAHVQVTAEPGRFLSGPSGTTISSVVGKAARGEQMWFYLDDGVYGSFSGQIYDHAQYPLTVFGERIEHPEGVLAGPTCDSIDVVAEEVGLPDMGLGDIVVGHQMGAYTAASATDFNSIARAKVIVINERDDRALEHQG
ncbi:MAG: type III PLP-dependent enzyme [Pseudomonadota bacterium]